MNKEEKKAIEILKDNIGILEGKLTIKYTNYNTVKAYNTILNLIDKQQKEIERLKENQIWSEATIEGLKTDFINKDKIREKIKEIENVETDKISREEYNRIEFAIDILQELLEE